MSRMNRKHTRNIERHRRNKGPALMSLVADNKLQEKATELVNGLAKATIDKGSAAAATLLVDLAERSDLVAEPAKLERVLTLAQKWASEPPFIDLEIVRPELEGGASQRQLADGSPGAASAGENAADTESDSDAEPLSGPPPPGSPGIIEAGHE